MNEFKQNKLLSDLSTFGIGGPATYFAEIRTIEEMCTALIACRTAKIPYMVLGKGSNCLFDDKGYAGAILLNKIDFFENPSSGTFHVGAGYSFSLLGTQTARQGWSGLEFASGIPGSVGGAVFMNAGANGHETCETITSVDFIDDNGELKQLTKDHLHFAYRCSSFQKMPGAIVGATFKLTPCSTARASQLKIITYRKKTQPYSEMSAGCIFKNPNGGFAGALIQQSGLKGSTIGGAKVSEMHANFIVNTAQATCKDVMQLINLIKSTVKNSTGIELESEVCYIPYEGKTYE